MINYKQLKKEIAFQLSKYMPAKIKKGINKGMLLYGCLFYNKRSQILSEEEKFYNSLDIKDKVIIEAGAHIGIYTMFFSKQINQGKILAFEPNPLCYYFLCKNIRMNRLDNIIPVNAGLADKEGIIHFVSDKYNSAKGTFKTDKQELIRKNKRNIIEKEIPVTTIDNAIKKYNLSSVYFVKIDTEGFEPFIFEGMKEVIKDFKPIIYFEIHGLNDQQRQDDLERVYNLLQPYEYKVIRIMKGLPSINMENIKDYSGGGYIAYKKMDKSLEKAVTYWKN